MPFMTVLLSKSSKNTRYHALTAAACIWHRAVVLASSNGLTFLQCCCVQAVRDVHCQLSQMFMEALRHVHGSYMCRMQVRLGVVCVCVGGVLG